MAAPQLGAEEGVGKTKQKETNTKNLQSRASVLRPDYPDHGPALSEGVGRTGKKAQKQTKGTTPSPALSTDRGGRQGERKAGPNMPSPIRKETPQL